MVPRAIPWHGLLVGAGVAQLILVVASLAIPRLLDWKGDLAKLRPLTRQVFWTYAGYIWVTNLSFGLLSTMAPQLLLDRSPLAEFVCGFIAGLLGGEGGDPVGYFDRTDVPKGRFFVLGETALVTLFAGLTVVYGGLVARAFGAWDHRRLQAAPCGGRCRHGRSPGDNHPPWFCRRAGEAVVVCALLCVGSDPGRRGGLGATQSRRAGGVPHAGDHRRLALRDEGRCLGRGSSSGSQATLDRPVARFRRALARNAAGSVRSSRRGGVGGSAQLLLGGASRMVIGLGMVVAGSADLGAHVVQAAGDATTSGGLEPDRPLRRIRLICGGLAMAGRRLSTIVPLSASIDQPARILGATVEPGIFRDDGDRGLSTPCPHRGPGTCAGGVVPGLGTAARTGDQRDRPAGYGLPMAYFILHGVLMTVEARLARAKRPIDRVPWIGRVWTLAWLLVPLPILFHRPFLAGVVWPLIGMDS